MPSLISVDRLFKGDLDFWLSMAGDVGDERLRAMGSGCMASDTEAWRNLVINGLKLRAGCTSSSSSCTSRLRLLH
eukprot:10014101-Lingulodinium_polyedra.AAC.1